MFVKYHKQERQLGRHVHQLEIATSLFLNQNTTQNHLPIDHTFQTPFLLTKAMHVLNLSLSAFNLTGNEVYAFSHLY